MTRKSRPEEDDKAVPARDHQWVLRLDLTKSDGG